MPKFHTRHIPPPGIDRDPTPPTTKLDRSVHRRLYSAFKEELLRPKSPYRMMVMTVPGFDPFTVKLEEVGLTALVAHWLQGLEVAATTFLLSDIDRSEDERALALVQNELIGLNEQIRPTIEQLFTMIRNEPRPLAATIHFGERTYDDVATLACCYSLADAFFDQFGAGD